MSSMHFIRLFAILYLSSLFCFLYADANNSSINSKPKPNIKMKLVKLEKCKIPLNRMVKNPSLIYNVTAKKIDRYTTVIQTNVAITARNGPVFFTFRGYQVQASSSKDLILNLERLPCTNPLILPLLKLVNFKLDKDCYYLPGNFSANIRIEDLQYIFSKSIISSGLYSYDIQFDINMSVAACVSITCDVTK